MAKTFREWNVEQHWAAAPSVMDFVPADHMAHFIRDTVREQLDLSEIVALTRRRSGLPALSPGDDDGAAAVCVLPGRVLLAAHCPGCEERMDFMAVTGLNRPDFPYGERFSQAPPGGPAGAVRAGAEAVSAAGLVKLGHVSLDGTKIKASASKHKAMSYERMRETELRLKREVREWFKQAQSADAAKIASTATRGAAMSCPTGWLDKQRRIARSAKPGRRWKPKRAPLAKRLRNRRRSETLPIGKAASCTKSGKEYVQGYQRSGGRRLPGASDCRAEPEHCANDVQQLARRSSKSS